MLRLKDCVIHCTAMSSCVMHYAAMSSCVMHCAAMSSCVMHRAAMSSCVMHRAAMSSCAAGQQVYCVRSRCGKQLALEAPADADLVSTIPESATPAALGYASQVGLA